MRLSRHLLLAAIALALLAGAPAAVAGRPVGIAESFPTKCNVDTVAAAPEGGAWFACTEYFFGRHLSFHSRAKAGRITAAGQVTEFSGPVPKETEPGRQAGGVITADGSFWFPVEVSLEALNHYVKTSVKPSLARVTSSGEMKLFPVTDGYVAELAAAPDGSLRMKTAAGLEGKDAAVWQVSPSGEMTKTADDPTLPLGEVASFPVKPPAAPGAIYGSSVIGKDGNLWFGIQSGGAIGRLTPTGEMTEFRECLRYGQPFFGPETLVRGAEGNIWFTSLAERSLPSIIDPPSIGMVTPAGAITQIYAGVKIEPKTIAAGPEGGAWFAGGLEEVQRIKPPQGPVNTVHIGKLSAIRRDGSALLTVKVPSGGRLRAKPVAIVVGQHPKKAKRTAIHAPTTTAKTAACGSPQIRVKLAGEALEQLRSSGEVQVAVAVTFAPTGGHAYSEEKTLRFQLPHHQ
jgi:virginiamycin B lyase